MGYSISKLAGCADRAIQEACRKSTGSSNRWIDSNGTAYFYDVSRRDHDDMSLTGTIWREIDGNRCQRAGSFKIDCNGNVVRGPAFMKRAAKQAMILTVSEANFHTGKMGKIEWYTSWDQGAPTAQAIEERIVSYLQSFKPGCLNNARGDRTMPSVSSAIVTSLSGETLATWQAPMFWVIPGI